MKKKLNLGLFSAFCASTFLQISAMNNAYALPAAGKMVNPAISAKSVVLRGGSNLAAKWAAPAIAPFKVWAQIPTGSTANSVIYYVYPKGNSVGNTICSTTDLTYPCFKVAVNQTTASSGWVQLKLNNNVNTKWNFGKNGFVIVKANGISTTQQLGVAQISFEDASTPLIIGQAYQGGKIAFLDSTKQHGFIAASQDVISGVAPWWNGTYAIKAATGTAIGTGQANTTDIVNAQGQSAFGAGSSYAAKWCDDFVLSGYSDWYLPSKDELNEMYKNKDIIGGFALGGYWSSTDDFDPITGIYTGAWGQIFNGVGTQFPDSMAGGHFVRCVRTF